MNNKIENWRGRRATKKKVTQNEGNMNKDIEGKNQINLNMK